MPPGRSLQLMHLLSLQENRQHCPACHIQQDMLRISSNKYQQFVESYRLCSLHMSTATSGVSVADRNAQARPTSLSRHISMHMLHSPQHRAYVPNDYKQLQTNKTDGILLYSPPQNSSMYTCVYECSHANRTSRPMQCHLNVNGMPHSSWKSIDL